MKLVIEELQGLEDGLYKLFEGDMYRGFVKILKHSIVGVQDNLSIESHAFGEQATRKNHPWHSQEVFDYIRSQGGFDTIKKMPNSSDERMDFGYRGFP